jgi:hypothetical protein
MQIVAAKEEIAEPYWIDGQSSLYMGTTLGIVRVSTPGSRQDIKLSFHALMTLD